MKKIAELNYKQAVFKTLILKVNEISRAVNRLAKRKPKIILKNKSNLSWRKWNEIICPKCKSKNIIKRGTRISLERGNIQRYECKSCLNRFTPITDEYRMRVNKFKLNKAFELRHKGYTLSQIAKKIKGVSRQTIMRWLKKYKIPFKEREVEVEIKSKIGKKPYKRKFKIKC